MMKDKRKSRTESEVTEVWTNVEILSMYIHFLMEYSKITWFQAPSAEGPQKIFMQPVRFVAWKRRDCKGMEI